VKGKGLQTIELVEQTLGKPSALNGVARRVSMRRRVRAWWPRLLVAN
jgi:transcriptional regulator GlxA family with amidase domain